MFSTKDPLEMIWDGLLSREPEQIRKTYVALTRASQRSILKHLQQMAAGSGWLPVQQQPAKYALDTLLPIINKDNDLSE